VPLPRLLRCHPVPQPLLGFVLHLGYLLTLEAVVAGLLLLRDDEVRLEELVVLLAPLSRPLLFLDIGKSSIELPFGFLLSSP
jgi:hypothetical protein